MILLAALSVSIGAQAAQAADAATAATTAIQQGNRQWEAGKLEQAQKSFEDAIKADPKSIDARMKLAGIQVTRLSYSGAIMTYRDVLAIDPNNAKAWMGMGMCYMHTGAREMARASFEEALRAEPARKAQIDPILAQLDEKIEAKRAQIQAMMPADSIHKGKAAVPTTKSATPSQSPKP